MSFELQRSSEIGAPAYCSFLGRVLANLGIWGVQVFGEGCGRVIVFICWFVRGLHGYMRLFDSLLNTTGSKSFCQALIPWF